MQITKYNGFEIKFEDDDTLSSKDVAKHYGVSVGNLRAQKSNHSDELIEGVHWISKLSNKKLPTTYWTLDGIHMLGFFIKSQEAKHFRKWVAKLLTEIRAERATVISTQLDLITPYEVRRDLATARRKLTIEKKKHQLTVQALEAEIMDLRSMRQHQSLSQQMIEELNLHIQNQTRIVLNNAMSQLGHSIDTSMILLKQKMNNNKLLT